LTLCRSLTDTAGVTLRVTAEHVHRARISLAQPGDQLHGGGLTGPVRAEDGYDLPFLDGEADVVHGDGRAVGLAQVAGFDHRHGQLLGAIRGIRRTSSA